MGKSEGRRLLGIPRIPRGRIILKWIIEKQDGWMWIGLFWLGRGISDGLL
jgi:hypothetical protein